MQPPLTSNLSNEAFFEFLRPNPRYAVDYIVNILTIEFALSRQNSFSSYTVLDILR